MTSHSTNRYKQFSKKVRKKSGLAFLSSLKMVLALVVLAFVGLIVFPEDLFSDISTFSTDQISKIDMSVEKIEVIGNERISREEILHKSGIHIGDNIMLSDLAEAREEISKEPWIASVSVERVMPDTIKIHISEEKPQALYIDGDKRYLINFAAKIVEQVQDQPSDGYLIVKGKDANLKFAALLDQIKNFDGIYTNIDYISLNEGRRWDIQLKNNIQIKLPEIRVVEALRFFEENFGNIAKLSKLCLVDLRLIPDKVYIKIM